MGFASTSSQLRLAGALSASLLAACSGARHGGAAASNGSARSGAQGGADSRSMAGSGGSVANASGAPTDAGSAPSDASASGGRDSGSDGGAAAAGTGGTSSGGSGGAGSGNGAGGAGGSGTSGTGGGGGTGGSGATASRDFITFLHGTTASANQMARDVAVDSAGNVLVVGGTTDPTFSNTNGKLGSSGAPTSTGAAGAMDVFVMKFTPGGSLIWSTLIGGPNYDRAYAVEVDATGIYVAGRAGEGFPTTTGALQTTFIGDTAPVNEYGKQDGFIVKLSLDGKSLLYSTYFGDDGSSVIRDIDIDSAGRVYPGCTAANANFAHITTGAFQTSNGGGFDGVVARLSADGSAVDFCTYLGGPADEGVTPSVRIAPNGDVLIAQGVKGGGGPTTAGVFAPSYLGGATDLLLTRLSSTGAMIASTYVGGNGADDGETHYLWVTATGEPIVGTYTTSTNLPTQSTSLQPAIGSSGADAWVARLSADLKTVQACTYLGNQGGGLAQGFASDALGNVIISGSSPSPNFPTTYATPGHVSGNNSAFLVKLDPTFSTLLFGTVVGGSDNDLGRACAVDGQGHVFVIGNTLSTDFPATTGTFQPTFVGTGGDGFLARFTVP